MEELCKCFWMEIYVKSCKTLQCWRDDCLKLEKRNKWKYQQKACIILSDKMRSQLVMLLATDKERFTIFCSLLSSSLSLLQITALLKIYFRKILTRTSNKTLIQNILLLIRLIYNEKEQQVHIITNHTLIYFVILKKAFSLFEKFFSSPLVFLISSTYYNKLYFNLFCYNMYLKLRKLFELPAISIKAQDILFSLLDLSLNVMCSRDGDLSLICCSFLILLFFCSFKVLIKLLNFAESDVENNIAREHIVIGMSDIYFSIIFFISSYLKFVHWFLL
ncbi:hypothetical protein RFI_20568 [Reticulomyxa filosa]|uniref:Uncharacterized protein n=1 Tax=Reticulomyxa filosa TaxID=46433 RepID=X6MTI6_RETFI|nr:hypothetical protein RFI_20568 [Reticulomyxa filosa]|eukprot:ETO16772.1 hypothetical protein RFI_20568 [Reticulomyxa filosa]